MINSEEKINKLSKRVNEIETALNGTHWHDKGISGSVDTINKELKRRQVRLNRLDTFVALNTTLVTILLVISIIEIGVNMTK